MVFEKFPKSISHVILDVKSDRRSLPIFEALVLIIHKQYMGLDLVKNENLLILL